VLYIELVVLPLFKLWFFDSMSAGQGAAPLRHLKGYDVTYKQREQLTKVRGVMNALLHFVQVRKLRLETR
jgi:hypothetical protein